MEIFRAMQEGLKLGDDVAATRAFVKEAAVDPERALKQLTPESRLSIGEGITFMRNNAAALRVDAALKELAGAVKATGPVDPAGLRTAAVTYGEKVGWLSGAGDAPKADLDSPHGFGLARHFG